MSDFRIEIFTPQAQLHDFDLVDQATLDHYLQRFRTTDWAKQAAQVPWAGNGWPGMAAIRKTDNVRFWFVAYDWQLDFGVNYLNYDPDRPLGFIVGISGIAEELDVTCSEAGRKVSECDFLYIHRDVIEDLVTHFFAGNDAALISDLLLCPPVNRFT